MFLGKAEVGITKRKALVLSYSLVARAPRVRRQIQWLSSAGFEVQVWGLGPRPNVWETESNEIYSPARVN